MPLESLPSPLQLIHSFVDLKLPPGGSSIPMPKLDAAVVTSFHTACQLFRNSV